MSLLLRIWRIMPFSKTIQLLIMRLFHDEFLIGVVGVIFNDKDEILLFKHTYRKSAWGLPSGYMKGREHPLEGIEREIHEESGLTVSIDEEMKIKTDRDSARLEICYIGVFIGGEFQKSDEVSEAAFFAFDNLPLLPKKQVLLIHEALKLKKK